jgi:hypothetical protein
MSMITQAPPPLMPEKPVASRDRGGRRTVTLDLRPEHFDRLASLARAQDLPTSTMARLLLLPALATEQGCDQ